MTAPSSAHVRRGVGLDDPVAHGDGGGLGSIIHLKFFQDAGHVGLRGTRPDEEGRRDVGVGPTGDQEAQDLQFAP